MGIKQNTMVRDTSTFSLPFQHLHRSHGITTHLPFIGTAEQPARYDQVDFNFLRCPESDPAITMEHLDLHSTHGAMDPPSFRSTSTSRQLVSCWPPCGSSSASSSCGPSWTGLRLILTPRQMAWINGGQPAQGFIKERGGQQPFGSVSADVRFNCR